MAFPHIQTYEGAAAPVFDDTDMALMSDEVPPVGIAIVGMSQAGKTTLRSMSHEVWQGYRPDSGVLDFSNSDGYRGITYEIQRRYGYDPSRPIEDVARYLAHVGDFAETASDEELNAALEHMYAQPRGPEDLRSPAVNSVVAATSEDIRLHPLVDKAGANHLRRIIAEPDAFGYDRRSGLVVVDARNYPECRRSFEAAGVTTLGAFVLTCDERAAVSRSQKNLTVAAFEAEVQRLRQRNKQDAARPLEVGPTTMPEDLAHAVDLGALAHRSTEEQLEAAGALVATTPDAGFVVRTDQLTLDQERWAFGHVFTGMLDAAEALYGLTYTPASVVTSEISGMVQLDS
jgi:hypothetical protein